MTSMGQPDQPGNKDSAESRHTVWHHSS